MRVTKAMLERELELARYREKALEEKLRSQWSIEAEAQQVRDANDILTIELEKERAQGKTLVAERIVTVPVPVRSPWLLRSNMMWLAWTVGLVALLLSSCAFAPSDAAPFTPPESYRTVWADAQACTGRTGDFDQLEFFVTPELLECSSGVCAGHADGRKIYLAEPYLNHPLVVKHEMIHALGVDDHPANPFETPCHATWATWDSLPKVLAL